MSLKIGKVTPEMCGYKTASHYILFSLGINEGNVKLHANIGNSEVQTRVLYE